MRALAKSLGSGASSLYYHFRRKRADDRHSQYLYRKLGQPPTGGGWADQVRGTFIQLQAFIQEHPNAAPLLLRDLARSPVARKRARVLLGILQRAGLDPVASASLVGNLVALLVGHSLLGLYLQAEAGSAAVDETGTGTATRSMRPWIPHLPGRGPGTVSRRIAPGEEDRYQVRSSDEPALELSEFLPLRSALIPSRLRNLRGTPFSWRVSMPCSRVLPSPALSEAKSGRFHRLGGSCRHQAGLTLGRP
jgi:AcrR family transcriptional regulator